MNQSKTAAKSSFELLIKGIIIENNNLESLNDEQISILKGHLFTTNQRLRKASAILILLLSKQNPKFRKKFQKKNLLHNYQKYTELSLKKNGAKVGPGRQNDFLSVLKRDQRFMKEDITCNGFLLKYTKSVDDTIGKSPEIHLVTMTELRFYFKENQFEYIPDPINYTFWYCTRDEETITTQLSSVTSLERLEIEKNHKMRCRKIRVVRRKNKNNFFIHDIHQNNQRSNQQKRRVKFKKRKSKSFQINKKYQKLGQGKNFRSRSTNKHTRGKSILKRGLTLRSRKEGKSLSLVKKEEKRFYSPNFTRKKFFHSKFFNQQNMKKFRMGDKRLDNSQKIFSQKKIRRSTQKHKTDSRTKNVSLKMRPKRRKFTSPLFIKKSPKKKNEDGNIMSRRKRSGFMRKGAQFIPEMSKDTLFEMSSSRENDMKKSFFFKKMRIKSKGYGSE